MNEKLKVIKIGPKFEIWLKIENGLKMKKNCRIQRDFGTGDG